jgi:hypothetical protein
MCLSVCVFVCQCANVVLAGWLMTRGNLALTRGLLSDTRRACSHAPELVAVFPFHHGRLPHGIPYRRRFHLLPSRLGGTHRQAVFRVGWARHSQLACTNWGPGTKGWLDGHAMLCCTPVLLRYRQVSAETMIGGSSWQQLLAGTEPRRATGSEEASCKPVLSLCHRTMRHGSSVDDAYGGGSEAV